MYCTLSLKLMEPETINMRKVLRCSEMEMEMEMVEMEMEMEMVLADHFHLEMEMEMVLKTFKFLFWCLKIEMTVPIERSLRVTSILCMIFPF